MIVQKKTYKALALLGGICLCLSGNNALAEQAKTKITSLDQYPSYIGVSEETSDGGQISVLCGVSSNGTKVEQNSRLNDKTITRKNPATGQVEYIRYSAAANGIAIARAIDPEDITPIILSPSGAMQFTAPTHTKRFLFQVERPAGETLARSCAVHENGDLSDCKVAEPFIPVGQAQQAVAALASHCKGILALPTLTSQLDPKAIEPENGPKTAEKLIAAQRLLSTLLQ